MDLWRVLNWSPSAASSADNGHPLFVWPDQGAGRVDDPDGDYLVLYLGDSPEGAIAEALGSFPTWSQAILDCPPAAPADSVKALVQNNCELDILDLDDPYELVQRGMRPSQVVTRSRTVTQVWARGIYESGDYAGVSWWPYYNPDWASLGLWALSGLSVVREPEVLSLDHPALRDAAYFIKRTVSSA
ncbi:RES domain-containing protein [Pseudarthrobacter sp. S9]|uniref:RES domain-containing protein n=1 Tax=Pseudarthrobacter sp. S9 TaxID=3418421 RepID=UPI003D014951